MRRVSISLAVVAVAEDYQTYEGKTCWNGHGAVEIDTDGTAPSGLDEDSCKARCDDDAQCDCVAFQPSIGKCWKRKDCVPDQFGPDQNYDVFVKTSPAPSPPAPSPPAPSPPAPSPPAPSPSPSPTPVPSGYAEYWSATCYNGHGGTEIDDDGSAPVGLDTSSCEARCDGDAKCDCVTFRPSDGKCWKRSHCVPDQFGHDDNFNTFVKPYTPSPPAPPTPGGGGSGCEGTSGWINQYEGNNPLNIKPAANREDNYFLIIGDWGKDGGPGSCQNRVADLMKQYVQNQAAQGKTLLFIASVGDNFYWSGQDGTKWSSQWGDVYGHADTTSPLYDIPWLAVLGNHDIGYTDPYLACPSNQVLASMGGQDYGSRQFNADKNPERPDWTSKYWMPDYNFHYEIPEVGVEVVGVDTNGDHIWDLNGHGHADAVFNFCGGSGNVQNFLGMIKDSGDDMLKCRAEKGTASTVLVMQHYPDNKWDVKGTFENALKMTGREAGVISAYGHDHEQKCEGTDEQGQCNVIMTGSGGGCCDTDLPKNHAGFTAIHLTKDGGFTSDVESDDVRLPRGACTWNYDYFTSWWNDTRANAYV